LESGYRAGARIALINRQEYREGKVRRKKGREGGKEGGRKER
jgi:hypothetical protein